MVTSKVERLIHNLQSITRFLREAAFLATLFIVGSMLAKADNPNVAQNGYSNAEAPTEVVCPPDTLFEPYTEVCAPVNDITHLFIPAGAVTGAEKSSTAKGWGERELDIPNLEELRNRDALRKGLAGEDGTPVLARAPEAASQTLDDLPVPGGIGAGITYKLGTHQALEHAVFHTKMFVQPEGVDSAAQDWWLMTPATNHTDSATEFVGIYANHLEEGWFGIFGRPCTEAYPCPDGDTSNGWQAGWSSPFSEFECNLTEIVDQGGHLQKVMHYANETVKLDQEDPPLWQNAVYLWNYCMDEWDLIWRHEYRESKRDCSIEPCYRWGPILETFGTQAEINELGCEDSLLFHDGRWSLLPPDETDFVPPISPWLLLHLDPNRGYGAGNRFVLPPLIDIEKLTNGSQADDANDADVPRLLPGTLATWTYEVTNTSQDAFAEADLLVTDSQPGITPVLDGTSDDGDLILSPGETWTYQAMAQVVELQTPPAGVTVVPGCGDDRNTYENIGRVEIISTGELDEDLSHYCNSPPAPVPALEDIIVDFGRSGLWAWMNDSAWLKLNNGSPERVVAGDLDGNTQDEVIADFPPLGIWVRRNLGAWTKLNGGTSEQLVVGDLDNDDKDDLIVDFGAAGLWVYMNDTNWLKLNSGSPEQVVTADVDGNGKDDVIGDFGASGIWIKRNQGGWAKLHPLGPEMMAVGDLDDNDRDDVLIDFGINGLWGYMNGASWLKLLSNSPDLIATGDIDGNGADDILAGFDLSGAGLWQRLNLENWSQLNTNAPDQVVTADVDGSGKDDIVATFASITDGLFIKRNQAAWVPLHNSTPESLAVGNLDGQ